MSLPKAKVQRTLFDAPVLVADLFKSNDRYRLFREKIMPTLWGMRDDLAELYCNDNGRPAIEPVIALAVTLLQFMEKAPDRNAAENVRLHLGWKYAMDMEIDYKGFDHSSLVKFRNRLLEANAQRIGFDALFDGLRKAGLVKKGRNKQRLDSTHMLGAVAKMGRMEMVRETLGLYLEDIRRAGLSQKLDDWEILEARYLDSQIAWHKINKDGLKEKFSQAGKDMRSLIGWLRMQASFIRDNDHALLLERVFCEQYELSPESPQRRKVEASGVVKNPHDPDVQWATKGKSKIKQWEGYKIQISETVDDEGKAKKKGVPTEQFITEVTTTEAIASDLDGRRRVENNQKEHGQNVADELYVDAAYVTDDTLAEARKDDRILMGPARPSSNPSGKNLFMADKFDVDVDSRKAVCPGGHESRQCSRLENHKTGQVDYRFEWAGLCDDCSLQKQCTKSRSGRRMLIVGEFHNDLQQRRREMQTDEFKKQMHQRNGVEGTISEFCRAGGRRTRYRGLAKTTLANYFMGAAVNANRWIRLTQWIIAEQEKAA